MKTRIFRCNACGNVLTTICDGGNIPYCCGSEMEELKAGTMDASVEKHVPDFEVDGDKVTVHIGKEEHPSTSDHYIKWILLKTNKGTYLRYLNPGDKPCACFKLCKGEEVECIYEYCSIHDLWKKEKD